MSTTYLNLPGGSGNNASFLLATTPLIMDYRIRLLLSDYTPAANAGFFGASSSYRQVLLLTGGALWARTHDGADRTAQSTVTLSSVVSDGQSVWVRSVVDSTGDTVNFYYSLETTNNPITVSWTALGAQVPLVMGTFSTISTVGIGSRDDAGANNPMTGRVYSAALLYDGAQVFVADFTKRNVGEPIFASTGQRVTLNGTTTLIQEPIAIGDRWEPLHHQKVLPRRPKHTRPRHHMIRGT
jgi:hypothetical protein